MENEIKCITFDKEAQDAIPEHVKLKMQADKDAAIVKALLQKIEVNNCATIQSLTWLSEQKNHGLQDCTEVVRFLLKKVSEIEGYKAAQSKGGWTDDELRDAFYAGIDYEVNCIENSSFEKFIADLKDFKTQQAIYKNYPNLNASKEEMDEMRKLK